MGHQPRTSLDFVLSRSLQYDQNTAVPLFNHSIAPSIPIPLTVKFRRNIYIHTQCVFSQGCRSLHQTVCITNEIEYIGNRSYSLGSASSSAALNIALRVRYVIYTQCVVHLTGERDVIYTPYLTARGVYQYLTLPRLVFAARPATSL